MDAGKHFYFAERYEPGKMADRVAEHCGRYPFATYYRLLITLVLAILTLGLGGPMTRSVTAAGATASQLPPNVFDKRYIMMFANVNKAEDVEHVLNVMQRGAAVGYNGMVLGDASGEYIVLESASPAYAQNFARIRNRAHELSMALIPLSFYPRQVTYKDPSLAEGLPCRDSLFRVQNGVATLDTSGQLLQNAGFEEQQGDGPSQWIVDQPGVIVGVDRTEKQYGQASVRITDPSTADRTNGHGRIVQQAQVTPYRAYRLSLWVKTRGLSDPASVKVYVAGIDGRHSILYQNRFAGLGAPVAKTQGWTKYTVYFNSVSNNMVAVYAGMWAQGGKAALGTAWIDSVSLEEVALTHMVRRSSLPVTVTSFDGRFRYAEGIDYVVEDGWLRIPAGSAIPNGMQLRVSWYLYADTLETTPPASACSDTYYEIQKDISGRLDQLFGSPSGFMMNYDEWRVANWDPSWGNISAGTYMAQVMQKSVNVLRSINPNYEVYVWSDMFDPHENAVDQYYLVNGSVRGSWTGLPQDIIIMTWAGGQQAYEFFASRGHRQMIAGYYDAFESVEPALAALDAAESRGARGVIGFMYTTWEHQYDDLERVAALLRAHGRWAGGTGSAGRIPVTVDGIAGPKQAYVSEE